MAIVEITNALAHLVQQVHRDKGRSSDFADSVIPVQTSNMLALRPRQYWIRTRLLATLSADALSYSAASADTSR